MYKQIVGNQDCVHLQLHRSYPFSLPNELIEFHTYFFDIGHVILAVLKTHGENALQNPNDYLIGIPVRFVLEHGYSMQNGLVVVDAPFSKAYGLDIPSYYTEY